MMAQASPTGQCPVNYDTLGTVVSDSHMLPYKETCLSSRSCDPTTNKNEAIQQEVIWLVFITNVE